MVRRTENDDTGKMDYCAYVPEDTADVDLVHSNSNANPAALPPERSDLC